MDLINYLPSFYHNSIEVVNLQSAFNSEKNLLSTLINDLESQIFVSSATWGLAYFEKLYSILIDNSKNFDERRSIIKSKMRGSGTTTVSMIQNVCLSYTNGEVDIIEDFQNYSFKIKFVSLLGIPMNIENLMGALNEIVPCHLAFSFEFKYNTHLKISRFTHKRLSKFTHKHIREMETNTLYNANLHISRFTHLQLNEYTYKQIRLKGGF